MTDQTLFERELEARLRAVAAQASRPFDAGAVARSAIDAAPARWPRGLAPTSRRLVLLLLAAVLLLAVALSGALVAGSRLFGDSVVPRPGPATLAIGGQDGFTLADADGANPRRVNASGPFFTPRWSPDGRMVAVTALLPDEMNAMLVFDAAGDLQGRANGVAGMDWSGDSQRLLVEAVAGPRLLVVPAQAGELDEPDVPEVPLPEGTLEIHGAAWLPDGRIVAGLTVAGEADDEHGLWILDPAGGSATRMGGDAGRNAVQPAVSPDGRRVAAGVVCGTTPGCEPKIRIMDTASGVRRSEVENAALYDRVLWAPDGDAIAYSFWLPGGRISAGWWEFDRETRVVDPWTDGRTIVQQVLPDGAGLLVLHEESGSAISGLWRVPLDGGAPVQVADDAYGAALQPATPGSPDPDGTQVPSGGAWVPQGYPGPIPASVAGRDPVAFCGVDRGGPADPARACLEKALATGRVAEIATDNETAEGWRIATILRTTPLGGGEVTFLTDPANTPPLWERQACDRIFVRADGVEIDGCGPLVRIP
jgi:hypothetical protein